MPTAPHVWKLICRRQPWARSADNGRLGQSRRASPVPWSLVVSSGSCCPLSNLIWVHHITIRERVLTLLIVQVLSGVLIKRRGLISAADRRARIGRPSPFLARKSSTN